MQLCLSEVKDTRWVLDQVCATVVRLTLEGLDLKWRSESASQEQTRVNEKSAEVTSANMCERECSGHLLGDGPEPLFQAVQGHLHPDS